FLFASEVLMSHLQLRVLIGALLTCGLIAFSNESTMRGQEKTKGVAASPTVFPEPTQFDSKPFAVTLGDDGLAVAYSPDGAIVAVGCADKMVRLFEPATGKLMVEFVGHTDAVAAIAFSRDGSRLAS